MFVVTWDSRRSSGHQAVADRQRAAQIAQTVCSVMPEAQVRVLPADAYGAAAVIERQQRQAPSRSTRSR